MQKQTAYKDLSDREIVNGILTNDIGIIEHFFYERCSKLFVYIINSVFVGKVQKDELLNELFLYLADKNWQKLRSFDFNSSLYTWTSVVAVRFFIKKRTMLIENDSSETLLISKMERIGNFPSDHMVDLQIAISRMPNPRYRKVIQMIDIEDQAPEDVAKQLDITVANLYNMHHRAVVQLKTIYFDK